MRSATRQASRAMSATSSRYRCSERKPSPVMFGAAARPRGQRSPSVRTFCRCLRERRKRNQWTQVMMNLPSAYHFGAGLALVRPRPSDTSINGPLVHNF